MKTNNTAPPLPLEHEQIELSHNASKVLKMRYLRRDSSGDVMESISQMLWRVAYHVAKVEENWGGDIETQTRIFYDLLASKRFFPNSPTFTGAGTDLGQLAACFVLPISDDMGKVESGIFRTLLNASLIQQSGGGNGFSFSRLRPRGSRVSTSGGEATGPVGFLKVYDKAFGEVAQGGTRRGANMAVLRVDHPDIEEFIICKSNEESLTNFNLSVGITDEFMHAVDQDADWELCFPDTTSSKYKNFDGTLYQARESEIPIKPFRRVKARHIWEMITKSAHKNGEPGVLFLDTANLTNPLPHLYELEATNPCGEQWLGPYENCCLGSINLAQHLKEPNEVDWDQLQETIHNAIRFLDDVVEANQYVPAVHQLEYAAKKARRIGLGIMGLADLLYHKGLRYGSDESLVFANRLMAFIRYHAMKASINLATVRGPFDAIKGSIFDPGRVIWEPPKPKFEGDDFVDKCPDNDWSSIIKGIKAHGIRNAAVLSIAPTGTLSTIAGCEGYGCEPVFALAYQRKVKNNGQTETLDYFSPLLEKALSRTALNSVEKALIHEQVMNTGSCQTDDLVPKEIKDVFVVAHDIDVEDHIRMQAALQSMVDNSISKTINLSAGASVEDVSDAMRLAWELGCKGVTVYVSGSRQRVVLETKSTNITKAVEPVPDDDRTEHLWNSMKKPRPGVLKGLTYRKDTPVGKTFITINTNGEGQPFEVFINTAKAGSETAAVSESLGRLISYILRMVSPLEPRKRLEEVYRQLWGIGGGRPRGFGKNRVRSLPDALAQVFSQHLDITSEDPGMLYPDQEPLDLLEDLLPSSLLDFDLCPNCGEASFVNEEGCASCYSCGHSEC